MDTDFYRRTERTLVRRLPERAAYDRATVHAILDEGFLCHLGFVVDGQPYVIPTGYARVGDTVFLHGSTGSRLGLRPGMDVCVTVTLVDGLVLARSAFHHSMNYRSVMAIGRTRPVTDPGEKEAALRALVEHIVPGRSDEVRGGDSRELAATAVLALPLAEVSAKVRTGPPKDDEPDYALPIWPGSSPWPSPPASPLPTRSSTRRSRPRPTWRRGPARARDPERLTDQLGHPRDQSPPLRPRVVGRADQHTVEPVEQEVGGKGGVGHRELSGGPPGLDQVGHHGPGPGEGVRLPEPGLVEQHVV